MTVLEEFLGNTYICKIHPDFKNESSYTEKTFEVEFKGTAEEPIVIIDGELQDDIASAVNNIFLGNWIAKRK